MDHRTEYRVEAEERDLCQVTLPSGGESRVGGWLLQISKSGCYVCFSLPDSPTLMVGHKVQLSFASDRLQKPLVALASVRERAEEKGSRRYGFRFIDRDEFDSRLWPMFQKLFNRRRIFRVEPNPDSRLEITLGVTRVGGSVQVRLIDVSAKGLAVRVPADRESEFAMVNRVGLGLSLPGCPVPLDLEGTIGNRLLLGGDLRYGIEFDAEGSENFERKSDAISRYVVQRQREILQKAR